MGVEIVMIDGKIGLPTRHVVVQGAGLASDLLGQAATGLTSRIIKSVEMTQSGNSH